MKLFKILSAGLVSLLGIGVVRTVLDKYKVGIYYIDKDDMEDENELYMDSMDLRGTPTHQCICGSNVFYLPVSFEDYEISTYMLDMQCANCGSMATAPTPVDRESTE